MREDVGLATGVNGQTLVRGEAMAARLPEAFPGPAIGISTAGDLSPELYRNTLYRSFHSDLARPPLADDFIGQGFDVLSHAVHRHQFRSPRV